jgi:hypothetical protein
MKKMKITTGFHGADIRDLGADPAKYAAALKQKILDLWPDAEVEVKWDENTTGFLPWDLRTHVTIEDATPEQWKDEDAIAQQVDEIDLDLSDPALWLEM